uniref:Uncharacterized protein n=1 Tax=Meloidogyne javanica TaxID=6303 RepID=A0A915MHT5_MELJA
MFYLRDIQTEYVPDALFSKNCLKHVPVPNMISTSIKAKINGISKDEPTCEKDPWELPKEDNINGWGAVIDSWDNIYPDRNQRNDEKDRSGGHDENAYSLAELGCEEEAKHAIELLNDTEFMNRKLRVMYSRKKTINVSTIMMKEAKRRRNRGGFNGE